MQLLYPSLKCQNILDFFRGPVVENIRLQGLEHVYMFTANKGKVYLRSYRYVCIFCYHIVHFDVHLTFAIN